MYESALGYVVGYARLAFLRLKCRSKVTVMPRPSLPSETSVNSMVEEGCRSAVERETATKVLRPRDTALF